MAHKKCVTFFEFLNGGGIGACFKKLYPPPVVMGNEFSGKDGVEKIEKYNEVRGRGRGAKQDAGEKDKKQ